MKVTLYKITLAAVMVLALVSVFTLPSSAANNVSPLRAEVNTFAPSDPTIDSVTPSSGLQGQTVDVLINGWFINDATSVSFSGTGVTAGTPVVIASYQIRCTLTISRTAPAGLRNITINYAHYSPKTANNAFNVIAVPPAIASVDPNSGQLGQTLTVTINGANFTGNPAVTFSGAGITVNNVTVNSTTQLTVNIRIGNNCVLGARNITVNAFGGTITLNNCFTVIPAQAMVSSNPNSHGSGSSSSVSTSNPVALSTITVSTASLSAAKVAPGTPVTVTANVANRSTVNGSTRLTVYVNGQEEDSQGVAVNSGSNTPVTFTVTRNEPGTYSVYVGGTNAGSFVVDGFADANLVLYISIAFVAIAFVAGLLLITRRRQPGR
jgi:hypothetical protein